MAEFCHAARDQSLPAGNQRRVARGSVGAMAEPDNEHLAAMRVEYGSVEKDGSPDLDVDWLADGWLALLRKWIGDAERAGIAEPNAMVLATVDAAGRPVSRSVLCKGVDEEGITFFTYYDSAKGDELAATPYASATFPWYVLNRQFHIRGPVTKVDPRATQDYWSKRPRGSQLGAWASHQSRPIASRAALVDQLAEVTARFAHSEQIPVPPNWGGYRIAPDVVEFWQGREDRLHNRIRVKGGHVERLQP
jgi:pyridoxamine 5'-phosphate oxidase